MRKMIFVGDACVATGFARGTHQIADRLHGTSYEVSILGINYRGGPHDYAYKVYPAKEKSDYDWLGVDYLPRLCRELQPDVIVLQNDVWNIPDYIKSLRKKKIDVPVVGFLAVDGKHVRGEHLDGLSLAIFWTKFAEQEAKEGGFTGPTAVVPLGVDLERYTVKDFDHAARVRVQAREMFHPMPNALIDIDAFRKGFIVGNVNRNQHRKRLDLTVEFFCKWVRRFDVRDAFLMLQACPTGEAAYDVPEMMRYYGLEDRLMFVVSEDIGQGIPENDMHWTYRSFDVQLTTTQGEGFGLTTFEGMACGIPQIVPDWSALGELCEEAALKVPCTSEAITLGQTVIGGVADREQSILALDMLYRRPELRADLATRGLRLVRQERYRWSHIAQAFDAAIEHALFAQPAEVAHV